MTGPGSVRRSAVLAGVAASALAAFAASAGAATIGQTPEPDTACTTPMVVADNGAAVPGPGQLTSFSVHSIASADGNIDFDVFRPTGTPGQYTTVAHTGEVALDPADTVQFVPVASQLLVLGGDVLGFSLPSATTFSPCLSASGTSVSFGSGSEPSPGDTVTLPTTTSGEQGVVSAEFTPSTPLDVKSSAPVTGPVLGDQAPYAITVRGTYSPFLPKLMSGAQHNWVVCGTTEAAPEFGADLGPVGQDAERIFARPHIGRCDPSYGFPHKYGAAHPAIEFDIGDGAGFHHVAPTDGSYHPDHTYTYVVIGHDQPLQVKLLDQPYSDNYGDLEIDVTPISQ